MVDTSNTEFTLTTLITVPVLKVLSSFFFLTFNLDLTEREQHGQLRSCDCPWHRPLREIPQSPGREAAGGGAPAASAVSSAMLCTPPGA